MRVLAIAGSLRTTSSNAALLRAGATVAPAGTEVVLYEGLADLPLFSPDLDVDPLPAPVAALRALIREVDAIVISSPEYAHGIPGALKNALDWLVSATEPLGKPWLLISASPTGAPHAHAHLLEVVRTMATQVIDGGGHVFSRAKLDATGAVTSPDLLAAFATGFRQLAAAAAALQAATA
ncbi:MAG TPA: NADPH-dependent FMN reductase [Kofleriaceae bacterium]|nr:NADPH-dependent FMN reductase [Kofleriaceae bacterium]